MWVKKSEDELALEEGKRKRFVHWGVLFLAASVFFVLLQRIGLSHDWEDLFRILFLLGLWLVLAPFSQRAKESLSRVCIRCGKNLSASNGRWFSVNDPVSCCGEVLPLYKLNWVEDGAAPGPGQGVPGVGADSTGGAFSSGPENSLLVVDKKLWVALGLNFFFFGLGYYYLGDYTKARKHLLSMAVMCAAFWGLIGYCLLPATRVSEWVPPALVLMVLWFTFYTVPVHVGLCRDVLRLQARQGCAERYTWIGVVAVLVFFVLSVNVIAFKIVKEKFLHPYRVHANGMQRTLIEGDRVIGDMNAYRHSQPQRGDVVCFLYPIMRNSVFIQRVVAVAGETVQIKDGQVLIDGKPVTDGAIAGIRYANAGDYYGSKGRAVTVPAGHYFVLGDNTASSNDSRYWGFLPKELVFSKIYKIFWPPERSGPLR
ncbi:MAG: signal peptidase I [Candidatus Omnitrophica bacterium]|nr:signal peptidase I [Candidatus Omnitrophota bacterium]